MAPSVIVPDEMLIDLADDIIDNLDHCFAYPDPHETIPLMFVVTA